MTNNQKEFYEQINLTTNGEVLVFVDEPALDMTIEEIGDAGDTLKSIIDTLSEPIMRRPRKITVRCGSNLPQPTLIELKRKPITRVIPKQCC